MSSLGDKAAAAVPEMTAAEEELSAIYQQTIDEQRALAESAVNPVPAEKRVL